MITYFSRREHRSKLAIKIYTRALDNIKSIRKEAAAKLKVEKEKYSALVIDKNCAEKQIFHLFFCPQWYCWQQQE
ncbi:hypothetical protein PPACK8108_LOCUS20881 [Phakopsora pachyrhizi]|uniref:Uncharacterized protein n=1 Tax=Phakopsora pachyrhizi TaxID=170000 RepID=A0AAV0BGF3_PHAPC|nr:hypothetical protein PPACK8108_LOCUS20881 [Phakopsora pachyrhizi]